MELFEIKKTILPVLKKYSIKRAGIFGSFARKGERPNDVDLLIEVIPPMSLLQIAQLKRELEELLGMKFDIVEYKAIKPKLKESVLAEEIPIYERP